MAEIRRLNPHDPLPGGHYVAVMRRFDEDDPKRVMVETIVGHASGAEETSRPQRADGFFMEYEEAVEAAKHLAERAGLAAVYAVDRTAGPRERDILAHGGDHSTGMDALSDTDLEEGERGPDMRDVGRAPPPES
jgi:hypothetical protein